MINQNLFVTPWRNMNRKDINIQNINGFLLLPRKSVIFNSAAADLKLSSDIFLSSSSMKQIDQFQKYFKSWAKNN